MRLTFHLYVLENGLQEQKQTHRILTVWANLLELQQLSQDDVPQNVISKHLEHHSEPKFSSSAPEVLQRVLCGWTRNPYCHQAPGFLCLCSVRTAGGGAKSGWDCGLKMK